MLVNHLGESVFNQCGSENTKVFIREGNGMYQAEILHCQGEEVISSYMSSRYDNLSDLEDELWMNDYEINIVIDDNLKKDISLSSNQYDVFCFMGNMKEDGFHYQEFIDCYIKKDGNKDLYFKLLMDEDDKVWKINGVIYLNNSIHDDFEVDDLKGLMKMRDKYLYDM